MKSLIRRALGIQNDTDFYSQGGEDAIAWKIASYVLTIEKGFYVDVGAYHPYKHSNTYLLYKAGWRGMNIEPRPGSKDLFDRERPGDINIEAGISDSDGEMDYLILGEESTMNTFQRSQIERFKAHVKDIARVPVYRLDRLLEEHNISSIDFLNVDAEGFEMQILNGMSVDPKIVAIEQNGVYTLKDVLESDVNDHLSKRGYEAVGKNVILKDTATVFYVHAV
jgi:FkbM family methyltransferase